MDLVNLSRLVSHALRHEPWLYELELDDEGWVPVPALLSALRHESPEFAALTAQNLAEMIRVSSKQRHELAGDRIRALYGHSVPTRIRRVPHAPPELLFHGTAPSTAALIRQSGLLPMGRQYVHLSADTQMATAVGSRKAAQPVVLVVRAASTAAAGIPFFPGNDRVWLADHVPSSFIEFP